MFAAIIDPYLLACPPVVEGIEKYEKFICSILNWKELSNSDFIKPYILSNTPQILSSINKYPLWEDLRIANETFGIDYIAPDAVMKLVTAFLTKFEHLQDKLQVEAFDYENFSIHPSVTDDGREPIFVTALEHLLILVSIKCHGGNDNIEEHLLITPLDADTEIEVNFQLLDVIFSRPVELDEYKFPEPKSYRINAFANFSDFCSVRQIILVKSGIKPSAKKIKLSDDHHGNDILKALADKMVYSPYVEEVINNLEYNSFTRRFAHKIYTDGTIDFHLPRTDKGFGMKIRTTGRNYLETAAIAKKLEEEFRNEY